MMPPVAQPAVPQVTGLWFRDAGIRLGYRFGTLGCLGLRIRGSTLGMQGLFLRTGTLVRNIGRLLPPYRLTSSMFWSGFFYGMDVRDISYTKCWQDSCVEGHECRLRVEVFG